MALDILQPSPAVPVTDSGCWQGQEPDVAGLVMLRRKQERRAAYAQSSLIASSQIPPQCGPVGGGSSPGPCLLSSCPLRCPPLHPVISELTSSSVMPRIECAAKNKGPPFNSETRPVSGSAHLCPGCLGRARVCLAYFHPNFVQEHCGKSRSRSRAERDETKLGAARPTMGTAKTALLFLVGEFPWFCGVGGEKGGAG